MLKALKWQYTNENWTPSIRMMCKLMSSWGMRMFVSDGPLAKVTTTDLLMQIDNWQKWTGLHLTINDPKGSHKRRIRSAILLDAGCKNFETDLQLHALPCTGIKSWDTVTLNMFIYIFLFVVQICGFEFFNPRTILADAGCRKRASSWHCEFAQLNGSMMTVGWQCVPLRRESTDFRAFEIVQWNVCWMLPLVGSLVAFVWKLHLAKFTWMVWSCSCSTKNHS